MDGTKFQTVVEIPDFKWEIGYSSKSMFVGSCFTENVGGKMSALKYNVDINPFGILYNPASVANALQLLLKNRIFNKEDLIQHDGLWHSFSHHGRFSSANYNSALKIINERIEYSSNFLKQADYLFITYGTAWIYTFSKTGQTVSNCHKIPAREFKRSKLTVDEIVENQIAALQELWKTNPKIKIIFTVSPVRHWKDGAVENQRSKATLLLAIEKIIKECGEKMCNYFPSYEIMMDELRDYRFYAEDMIHISDVAINHFWERFQIKLIEPESLKISNEVKKIINAVNHKPINKFTKENLFFLKNTLAKIEELIKKYPVLNWKQEKDYLFDQINEIESWNRKK